MVINPLIAGPPHCAPSLSLYLSITPSLSPPQTHVTLGEDRRVTNTQTEENNYKLVRKVLQVEMIVPAYCKGKQTQERTSPVEGFKKDYLEERAPLKRRIPGKRLQLVFIFC